MRSSYVCDLYCFVCCCYLFLCALIFITSYTLIKYILMAVGVIAHIYLLYSCCKPDKQNLSYIIIINPDETMSLGVYSVSDIV